ncbi:MAG: outer membrane protein assembly factor BamA [Deltaproteobacteria bacterium]|nr:outer membrane protein assembly factor BamA [Deltaproteobacteria bacterium]
MSDIVININDPARDKAKLEEMVRNLIFLRIGDTFSDARLRDSINALRLSKKFRDIHVDTKEETGTITLIFKLTPFQLIKDIKIAGEFPLFEREISNAMTIYIGDAFIREDLQKQKALITELLKREGFIEPTVKITAWEDKKDSHFVVHINIIKGTYYTLDNLDINGNLVFSDEKLKLKMKSWRATLQPGSSGRFIEEALKKDIKTLTSYYYSQGYADAVIDYSTEKNIETESVSVSMTIDEGLQYDISFSGNQEFWEITLRKDLVLFESGNRNDLGLKKSVKKIKERYRKAGYLETGITIKEETKPEYTQTLRTITLVIDEGPRTIVNSLKIEGNKSLNEDKIKKQMLTRLPGFMEKGVYIPEELEEDAFAIKSLYAREGYTDAAVVDDVQWTEDKTNVDIKVLITEGVRTIVSSITIEGITVLTNEEAYGAILLKEGEPFRNYLIRSDENALAQLISEKGYPHVKVRGAVTISDNKTKADIVYRGEEGPYVRMGETYYTGNFRTKEKILENELALKPGESFSLTTLLQGQRNIRNMDIFDNVRFKTIGLKEKADTVNLIAEVSEKKPYFVELGGGYESDRGLFAQTKAGDHNLFGTNKYGWIGGETSQIGYRGDMGLTEPRLFGTRTSMSLDLFTERIEEFNQDFGTKSYGSSIGFTQKWFQHVTTGLAFRFQQRQQYMLDSWDPATSSFTEDEFAERSILVTTPSLTYDTRDSFIRPRKGIYSLLSVDISKGLKNSLDDFLKYRLDIRCFTTTFHRLTFAWIGRVGYINPYGSQGTIPQDQLFYLGGTTDVRGFDENLLRFDEEGNPVGGKTALSASIEARIDLGRNIELTPFYDTGSVRHTFDESGSDSFRSSVGIGLRYITPIGPIGFLYGHKLNRRDGESAGRFHFSIGYTF